LCQQGAFEPEVVTRLVQLARPGTSVFDIGANIGLMAVPVLQSCATCSVVSFEPSPNSLPYLMQTLSHSPFSSRWRVIDKALSHEEGELEFVYGEPKDALFEGFKSEDRIANALRKKVRVSTLDREWHDLGEPLVSVIKIDVEGAEGCVLEGSRQIVRRCRPHLIVEWYEAYLKSFNTPNDQLLAIAKEFEYRIFTVAAGVPVVDAKTLDVQMMLCSNFLLVPE
jgi:FkbM family methyltransferase